MSRFGVKIIAAMLLLAIIPLVASVYLVDDVIRVSDSVTTGQLRRLQRPLERAGDAYRSLFTARKRLFKLQARLLAADPLLRELGSQRISRQVKIELAQRLRVLSEAYPDLGELTLYGPQQRPVAHAASRLRSASQSHRRLRVELPVTARLSLEMVFLTPSAAFADFRALGRAQRTAGEIARLRKDLGSFYRMVFIIMFGAALFGASLLGLLFARRAARRVNRLLQATRRVAAGDLDTSVQLDVRDELGQLARGFNEMVAQLKESRERIGYLEKIGAWQEIARRLAHEIKNPLTPIQLAVQQLDRKYRGDDERFRELLDEVRDIVTEEVDGLRRLVGAFSAFARLPDVRAEPVQLNGLIEDFLKSHAELAQSSDLVWRPLDRDVAVRADRMLIKHVLFNLVENAIQAASETEHERISVVLSASVDRARERIELTVTDDGPGMSAETVARAFDPYFTTKEHGTGLGLAIVKKIVLEHGGKITVSSQGGVGTTFRLSLPLAAESAGKERTRPE